MHTPIDHSTVDEKIQRFLSGKSPLKTFSKTIAARFTPETEMTKNGKSGITYEAMDWSHGSVAHSGLQKAH